MLNIKDSQYERFFVFKQNFLNMMILTLSVGYLDRSDIPFVSYFFNNMV